MSDVYQFAEGFQLKILALMARDQTTFVTYKDVLKPKYFRKDVHIDFARIIHDHYERELDRQRVKKTGINPPTFEILGEEIRKLLAKNKKKSQIKEQYIETAVDIVDIDLTDREYIIDSLVEFGKNAALEQAILESVEELEKGKTGGGTDYGLIKDKISKAIEVGEDIGDLGTDYYEEIEERAERYEQGIEGVDRVPTGLAGVDKVMKGGLGRGELGVIMAPPNRGKSFALANIGAGAMTANYHVAHFTLEMPERQVTKRYDNRLLNKDFDFLKSNKSKIVTAVKNMAKLNRGRLFVKKYPTNGSTVDTLRSYLTRLRIEKGITPDVVIVDYADLLQPRRTYSDKRFELESIYLDLRDLAEEFNCAVWTASQVNRGGLDKKVITIGDLAEAFNKANIADFMVALCQTIEEKEDGEMRWHVAKHRDGEANMTLDGDIVYETAFMTVEEAS